MSENLLAAVNVDSENQCSIHEKEAISYFCKSHDALGCIKCFLSDHINCRNMVDIESHKKEILDTNSQNLLDELKRIEEHLLKYVEKNECDLKRLEQQLQDVLTYIQTTKDHVLKLIENLERDVERQKKLIYDEEFTKKSEEIHQCQTLLAKVQTSFQRLDAVIVNGNKTQNFVTEYQEQRRMIILRDHVFSRYGKIESKNVKITLCDDLQALLSLRDSELGRLKTEYKIETLTRINRTLHNGGSVKVSTCLNLWRVFCSHDYTGAALLSTDDVILIDKRKQMCCMYDSQFRHRNHYRFGTEPGDVCVFDDGEMAVSLPNEKKIQFLTCTAPASNEKKVQFTSSKSIPAKYYCDGLTVLGKDKLVISGYNDTGNKNYCWNILTTSGKDEYYHEIPQEGSKGTYLATNKSKTCIYMSCFDINTVYCFGLDRHLHFEYKNQGLAGPMGIGVDRDGNIYIVGHISHNIHQLSQDGCLINILVSGIPTAPQKIAFSVDGLTSLITNQGEGNKCYIFKLK